jgi:hypothetical protein
MKEDDFLEWNDTPAKVDYLFAAFCWTLVLGPVVIALATWSAWWLFLYIPVLLIFGYA